MHWKRKAKIQNAVALLPASTSIDVYYWIQRTFGDLQHSNPLQKLKYGIQTWQRIVESGANPIGKVFFELGTGRQPLVPLAYWLMGAEKIVTIDLNPYLKWELIRESLQYVSKNRAEIKGIFGPMLNENRFDNLLLHFNGADFSTREFLDLCQIDYIAPGNAANTLLQSKSVDFYTSCSVLEHIPPEELRKILREGVRLVKDTGLFVNLIDYTDHFSHSDNCISAINFLQYSEVEWDQYAGNRYMYANRLRHDDFIAVFESEEHRILDDEPFVDPRTLELVKSGTFRFNDRFSSKPDEILSTTLAWIVSTGS